ncbi:MAG: ParB N-terminal domain-containing protein [Verrucomicrobiia bacterium]
MMNQIRLIDPKKITDHELLHHLPVLAPDDPSIQKVAQSISDLGRITDPLKITERGELVDGRRRRAAALRLKLKEVPVVYVPDNEVPALIVAQLEARAHYTKGQRAYLLLPFIQQAFEYARERRLAALRQGNTSGNELFRDGAKRVEDWATSIGVTPRLLQQAQELRKFFEDHTPRTLTDEDGRTEEGVSFQEFFEPRILREEKPYGLGAALAGIKAKLAMEAAAAKGRPHTGGKPKAVEQQLKLFGRLITDELNRWEYWQAWDEDTRAEHWQAVRERIAAVPKTQADLMSQYHAKLAGEFRRAAKQEDQTIC